ncbi:hypothetical protein FG99_00910 [Pseudomonas sp. AAC]|nr:hypothetical protein FG99_00910 [Pseudomonas sp. AAC]OHS15569.1 hypothetical protein HMPREF3289_05720 [Pseudomonas sp. HMSC75E02]
MMLPLLVTAAGTAAAAARLATLRGLVRSIELGRITGILQRGHQRLDIGVPIDAHPSRREVDRNLGNTSDRRQCSIHVADARSAAHAFNVQIKIFHRGDSSIISLIARNTG